jgi:hypothetical protein
MNVRRLASEVINELEMRVARLERQARSYFPTEEEAIREYDTQNGWVVLNKSEFKSYLQEVWDMYVKTYKKIGLTVSSPQGLFKYKVWYVHFDDGVPVAFNLFKPTGFGLKSGLSGSDMSSKGKSVSKAWIKSRWKSVPNFYAEVSGAVEHIAIKSGCPVVCASLVEGVLGKPTNGYEDDNVHYIRNFDGHNHTKIMIGRPRGISTLSYRDALVSCPIPDGSVRLARHERTSSFEDRLAHDCSTYENSLFER